MGHALRRRRGRRRDPADAARHLLPDRGRGSAGPPSRACSGASPTAPPTPGRRGSPRSRDGPGCGSGWPPTRCGPCRGPRCAPSPRWRPAGRRRPLHVHLSEQPAENAACLAAYGLTPTGLLAAEGAARPGHHRRARHPPERRRRRAARRQRHDRLPLPDDRGRPRRRPRPRPGPADAGCPLALGGDQHAVGDLFADARGLEMHERLAVGGAGPVHARRRCSTRSPPAPRPSAGPTPARLEPGRARRPRRRPARHPAHRRRRPGPDSGPRRERRRRRHGGRRRARRRRGGRHVLGDVGRLLQEAIVPLWEGL